MSLLFPKIHSSQDGWGPLHDWQPESFNELNIGYAPFSKLEKLGKAADWTNLTRTSARQQNQGTSPFEEDEHEFQIVDSRQTRGLNKTGFQQRQNKTRQQQRTRGGGHWQDQQQRGGQKGRPQQQQQQRGGGQRGGRGGRRGGGYNAQQHQRKSSTSVDIEPSWGEAVGVIDFNNISNSAEPVPKSDLIESYGSIRRYSNVFDRLSVKQEKPLERGWAAELKFHHVSTSDDPVMKGLIEQNVANIYCTDSILAVLMSLLRSAYGFDILVTKDANGNIFLDKRDDFLFDYLSVNENSNEPPFDESDVVCNTVEALHKEATTVNYNFSQQVLMKDAESQVSFNKPNPFASAGEHLPSVGYQYRTFDLGDNVKICVRSEIDSYEIVTVKGQTKTKNLLVKSLLEYDQKVTGGWRMKLENQKAGCFATELKSNNCKLTKWLLQAHMAGVPNLKIGWVSRTHGHKDPYAHSVLAVTDHPVAELTSELGVDLQQVWGGLKYILNILQKYSEGSYIILRDPTKKTVYIYKTLPGEFKSKK